MRKYSINEFTIEKDVFDDFGYFARIHTKANNWPFAVPKNIIIDYVTQDVIDSDFTHGDFPYCKSKADAEMALIIAITHHNEYVTEHEAL